MNFSGKARRRRENFEDFDFKIIDFMKKIDENQLQSLNFLGAFGADPHQNKGGYKPSRGK